MFLFNAPTVFNIHSYAAVQVGMGVKRGHTFCTALNRRSLRTKIFVATVNPKRIAFVDPYYSRLAIIPATTCCSVCSVGEIPYKHLAVGKSKPSKRRGPRIREIDD